MSAITTTARSSTLAVQITEVENKLRPPVQDEILAGLKWLLDVGVSYSMSMKPGEEEDAYISILKGVPMCGLKKALTKFRNGEYENMNYAFIPLPAELAAMSRAEAKADRDDLARLRDTKRTIDETTAEAPKVSDEGKARIREMLANFRASHRMAKEAERGQVVAEVTPEKADMLRKILALPDAKEVSAEHIRNRQVAEKLIAAAGETE